LSNIIECEKACFSDVYTSRLSRNRDFYSHTIIEADKINTSLIPLLNIVFRSKQYYFYSTVAERTLPEEHDDTAFQLLVLAICVACFHIRLLY